ncbi:MAG: NADH-ubiquinone oxidoreductase subunit NDUFA12 family protein [Alphaproteobacteria bacterium]|nr:NADH-ubiquinone oxidoreductase subunit NDUFA12 family protein [Alphaproteobacteria bacterium]
MFESLSFVRRISQIGTRLHIALFGVFVGEDAMGNRYYRSLGQPERRWVLYRGEAEASLVSPLWFGWLHHQCDQPLPEDEEVRYPWQKAPEPNLTGTPYAYAAPASRVWQARPTQDEARQSWQGIFEGDHNGTQCD